MEYVIVSYPTARDVYIDGKKNGETNKSLRVETGTHRFDLGSPVDYRPESREVDVRDSNVLEPVEIEFVPA